MNEWMNEIPEESYTSYKPVPWCQMGLYKWKEPDYIKELTSISVKC
jgi:hypothetical protein